MSHPSKTTLIACLGVAAFTALLALCYNASDKPAAAQVPLGGVRNDWHDAEDDREKTAVRDLGPGRSRVCEIINDLRGTFVLYISPSWEIIIKSDGECLYVYEYSPERRSYIKKTVVCFLEAVVKEARRHEFHHHTGVECILDCIAPFLDRPEELLLTTRVPVIAVVYDLRAPDRCRLFLPIKFGGTGSTARVSDNGRYFAGCGEQRGIEWVTVWDLASREPVLQKNLSFRTQTGMMKGRLLGQEIAISASGNRVAYRRLYEGPAGPTTRCQELYVWDVASKQCIFEHKDSCETAAKCCKQGLIGGFPQMTFVGENGDSLVTWWSKHKLRHIDLTNGKDICCTEVCSYLPYILCEYELSPVLASPDGRWLITGKLFWDLQHHELVGSVAGELAYYYSRFAPGGSTLIFIHGLPYDLMSFPEECPEASECMNADMEKLWLKLSSSDRFAAFNALRAFVQKSDEAAPFLREKLLRLGGAAIDIPESEIVKRLGSANFQEREEFQNLLLKNPLHAYPMLKRLQVHAGQLEPEVRRRVVTLSDTTRLAVSAARWGIAALEYMETKEALEALQLLAKTSTNDLIRKEAEMALRRRSSRKVHLVP